MYFTRISIQGFSSLPDQQIELENGLNILVDRSHLWHGFMPVLLSVMLYGLSPDARNYLLPGDEEASCELLFTDRSRSYSLRVAFEPDGESVAIKAMTAPDEVLQRGNSSAAHAELAAASDTSLSIHGQEHALLGTSFRIADLRSGFDEALRSLTAERERISKVLDAVSLKALQDRAARARRLVAELNRLEREWKSIPLAGQSLGDDVMTVRSLNQHIVSLTSVISSKEEKVRNMRDQLEAARSKFDFYEYLNGIGINEINTVKRSLERKRWLLDDLEELDAEIEQTAKRIDSIFSMIGKYERLTPFLGRREMELDYLEDSLRQLEARLPVDKLQQIEAEIRVVRLQIQHFRKRRSIASVLTLLPLPFTYFWPPVALLSVVGAAFVHKYWREVTSLVNRMAEVDDRRDYLILEKNQIEARMTGLKQHINAIYEETGVTSAAELHDKIEDYQRLLSEFEDLKRKADKNEKARDELLFKLREEEQRAGVLFDRIGLSAELNAETVDRFVDMVNSRIDQERSLKELERKIEAEQSEINNLLRRVNTLQRRVDEILEVYDVRSVSELEELWDSSDAHQAKRLYDEKNEELRQLLNGQRLSDLEARIDLLSQLVPEADRDLEIQPETSLDQLEAQLESIRIRIDLLNWLKRSAMPVVVELAGEGAKDGLEMRQECVELCWMSRARQVLVLVQDESWEAAIRDVAGDLGMSTHTVTLGGYDPKTEITEV